MKRQSACIAIATLFAAGAVHAQDAEKGWYMGVNVGQSKVEFERLQVTGATASSSTADETDAGAKVLAGYRFNENFALEAGWMRFGEFNTCTSVTAPVVGTACSSIKSDGFFLDAVGIIPLQGGLSVQGRLGAMHSNTRAQRTTTGAVALAAGTPIDPKRSETNWKWGVGVGYEINKNVGLRFNYDQVMDLGDARTGEGDAGMWSFGFVLKF